MFRRSRIPENRHEQRFAWRFMRLTGFRTEAVVRSSPRGWFLFTRCSSLAGTPGGWSAPLLVGTCTATADIGVDLAALDHR